MLTSFEVALMEFVMGFLLMGAFYWFVKTTRQNRMTKSLAFTQTTHLHPFLGDIELPEKNVGVEPKIVVDVLGTTQEITEMIPCPVCGLVMPDDVWRDHAEQTGHALKKYDVQAAERGIGMV